MSRSSGTGSESLGDLLRDIDRVDGSLVVLVDDTKPTSTASRVTLVPYRRPFLCPVGMKYLMSVQTLREVVEVWSAWRDGAIPAVEQAAEAVVYYADHDCYLPVEEAGDGVE